MVGNKGRGGRALRVAVGITALVLLLAGGAGATKSINDNATGGECTSIGTWNVASKTCTLTTDLTETIEIDSDSITLDGNGHTITGSYTGNGIYLPGRSGVTIKNTNVRNFNDGIILEYSSNNNTLSGNTANSNNWDGIYLYSSCNNNTLNNNTASNNGGGIYLFSSSNNTLSSNTASNNGEGIHLYWSGNNTLSGNNASSNNYDGIILGYSSKNKIYNNIFNNTNNFYFYGGTTSNTWNTTKTSGTNIVGGSYLGGNVWAYPNGTGYSQTCADSNSDGICDSTYTLDGSNIDYLPLAYKFTSTPTANVSISGFSFQPQTTNVSAGTTVTWTNLDSTSHTVTSDTGLFDSGSLSNGQTFSRTFNTAGNYDYHCSIHSFMTGRVVVSSLPTILGNIAYSNNGTGISGVTVNLTNASGVIATTATNSSGGYNFVNVIPGSYNVTASIPRFFSNSTGVVVTSGSTSTVNLNLWLKGDLNNNGVSADAGDLVLMKRAAIGEIPADFRYDLNNNGIVADAGDLVLMKRAAIGEIILS